MKMMTMSWGEMPTYEEFCEHFCEHVDGNYRIRNSPVSGNADFDAHELWGHLNQLMDRCEDREDGPVFESEVSAILYTLDFEWI